MKLGSLLRRVFSVFSRRRAHRRAPVAVSVDWHEFGSAVHCVSATADLSRGGAFVRTAAPKRPGAPIVLVLGVPGAAIEAHARVAWVGDGGMGVRFTRALPAYVEAT